MAEIIKPRRHCAPNRTPKPGRRRRVWHLSSDGFRELRLSLALSQPACAQLLGVCLRTVRHWDCGRNRVPWSAVRLLRILRGGELPATGFEGWTVRDGGRLVTPAGVEFRVHEFAWWALTCLQARSWQRSWDRRASVRPSAAESLPAALPVADGGAFDLAIRPASGSDAAAAVGGRVADSPPPAEPAVLDGSSSEGSGKRRRAQARPASASTGLVLLKTSGTAGAQIRMAPASPEVPGEG